MLFVYSYLLYGCAIWSRATENILNTITALEKECLTVIQMISL